VITSGERRLRFTPFRQFSLCSPGAIPPSTRMTGGVVSSSFDLLVTNVTVGERYCPVEVRRRKVPGATQVLAKHGCGVAVPDQRWSEDESKRRCGRPAELAALEQSHERPRGGTALRNRAAYGTRDERQSRGRTDGNSAETSWASPRPSSSRLRRRRARRGSPWHTSRKRPQAQ
jgi:hypothetical protein